MSSFRITTNGMFRNYRTNLYKNNNKLQNAMIGVQTERKFNTYAEDPAAASKAWRLRRSYWLNEDQIDNTNHVISKFESASQAMHAIVDGDAGNGEYGLNGILASIEGLTDSAGSARTALGKELIQTAENMVSVMNGKYGEDFVFAGADGANVPFSWSADGKLLYRNVRVDLEEPRSLEEFGLTKDVMDQYGLTSIAQGEDYDSTKTNLEAAHLEKPLTPEEFEAEKANGTQSGTYVDYKTAYMNRNRDDAANNVKVSSFEEAQGIYSKLSTYKAYSSAYSERNGVSYEAGSMDYPKLDKMAAETTYVDIGLGMQEDEDGNLIAGSAFNSAVSGLKFLGYGKDKNLASIVRELGDIYSRADPETGAYENGTKDEDRANELLDALHAAIQSAQDQHIQLESDAKYLNTNLAQLKVNKDQMNTQINDTERMDMAEAITEMSWAQYCYNAALRIGTNILSQSLIDYMG